MPHRLPGSGRTGRRRMARSSEGWTGAAARPENGKRQQKQKERKKWVTVQQYNNKRRYNSATDNRPTCTYVYLRVPTCTYMYLHVHVYLHVYLYVEFCAMHTTIHQRCVFRDTAHVHVFAFFERGASAYYGGDTLPHLCMQERER